MPPEHCNRCRGSRIMRQSTSVRAATARALIERFRECGGRRAANLDRAAYIQGRNAEVKRYFTESCFEGH
jgi:hypothetical protein